ncbi:MBL fold metallo-hydrolase [Sphingobium sufflavum]|uniref:MBL fold metallo-hydrolase n=1 Tax=Sphingobium sufflavum TaxID=1129547 RepID=UPI001F3A1C41|nr:MBL fold metallo-hydrolase [Sphingobium sufflavum]MCE7797806.1 MBL fold metallo-hydrolase [Sphingobium sufflavum]
MTDTPPAGPDRPAIPQRIPMPTGDAIALSPRVTRVLAPNPSPFTYTGTQSYLVGTTELAVIDPGPAEEAHLAALLRAIGERPVKAILCTHTHRDHSPAAAPLAKATGATIIGCAPFAITDDGPRADAAFDTGYAPDAILTDGDAVIGEGWTLRAVHTPGHTSNHLCYALEEEGALFTGDHVMGWSTSVVSPPDGDMTDYMLSLNKLMEREDAIFYPAHGEAIENPRRLVRGMIGHRKMREGQILRFLGANGASAIPTMVLDMYKGVDPGLHPAAGRSVQAHLIDLDARSKVRLRDDERWELVA